MHLLYLDESGVHAEASYFVLAGLAVFEREIYWYTQDADAIQAKYFPNEKLPIEFHAAILRSESPKDTSNPYSNLTKEQRKNMVRDIYQIIRSRKGVLFGVAIEKGWLTDGNPYERAFEDLVSRFDLYLRRINAQQKDRDEDRGIIAVAESSYRRNLEILGEKFRGGVVLVGVKLKH